MSSQFRDQIAQADLCILLEEAQQSVTFGVERNNDLEAELSKARLERDDSKNQVVAVQQENDNLKYKWKHRSIISKVFV